jgi:hypothetical protein
MTRLNGSAAESEMPRCYKDHRHHLREKPIPEARNSAHLQRDHHRPSRQRSDQHQRVHPTTQPRRPGWVVLGPEVSHLANLCQAMAMVAKVNSPALRRPWLVRLLPPRR